MLMKTIAAVAFVSCCTLFSAAAGAQEGLKLSLTLSGVPASAGARRSLPATLVPDSGTARARGFDYRIGPDDLLDVQVFGVDQLSRTVRVDSRGAISLPLIGVVEVAGLTIGEAQARITAMLAESYLQDPQVSLFIKEFTTQRITVEGAVNKPGVYPLKGHTTLLTAIALAGGQGRYSDMKEVILFRTDNRGTRTWSKHDVERIRRGEDEDPVVVNEDLVVVNRSTGRVALRDSIFGDLIDTINPFRFVPGQ